MVVLLLEAGPAATSVLVAVSPLLKGVGGRYFADCGEAAVLDRRGAPL